MSRSLLACIINNVQLCCKNQPKLRKKAALLTRDIAAVCFGLRTAIMVDYMPLTAAAMLAILAKAETQTATLQQAQRPQLTLLKLDDCLYLVRHDALQLRLEQMSTCNNDPAYITISNVNDIPCLTMASEHDVKDVTHQLQHMCNLILSATPGRNNSSCTLMDLTSVEGVPIMPTLSGWLLQYPVVYLARPDTAVIMAQLLSEAVLMLYNVQVAGLFMEDLKQLSASQCQLASLYAFTVPETLLSNCSGAISRWEIDVAERCLPTATDNILTDHTICSCRLAPHHVQM